MTEELKKKWVDALRSGEYKQGFRRLRNGNDEYCCLGVLCEVAHIPYHSDAWTLPEPLYRCFYTGLQHNLMQKNDSGYNFREIADWIEENVPVEVNA